LKDDYLIPEDWQILCKTRYFLQLFWKITQLTEGYYSILDCILFTIDVLYKYYNQAFNKYKDNQQLLGCILTSWYIFEKYYKLSDKSPAYTAVLILYLLQRKAYIQKNWPRSWYKKIFNNVKKLWEDNYKGLPTIDPIPSLVPRLQLDKYNLLAQELDVVGIVSSIDEYKVYTLQTPILIDCSLLAW
jgi:hypothetical protein